MPRSTSPTPVAGGFAIELRPVAELVPYARNSRTHSSDQVEQIKASFRRFGMNTPIGVDAEGIIVGHGRVLALASMFAAGEEVFGPGKREPLPKGMAPTLDLSGLSEDERRAYVIADNQLAMNAGWDFDNLRLELNELADNGFDLPVIGFSGDELADLMHQPVVGLTDPDDAPPCPELVTSLPGDVWILGPHRVMCGDSTLKTDVEQLLSGRSPHLMVTDPPYGVNYEPSWRRKAGLVGEGAAEGKVSNDDRADWREAWRLFPGHVCYVWHGGLHSLEVAESLASVRLLPRAQIVWVKTRHAISRGHYHWQHEPAFYAVKDGVADDAWQRFDEEHGSATYAAKAGKPARWRGGRKQSTVWFIEHLKNDTGHSTQKPVECMKRPIENNSVPGEAVYDPFLGSGTTLVAGEMTGRPVFGMDLDPAYIDVAVERWERFTGLPAILEADGRTFDEVRDQRTKAKPVAA